MLVLGALNWVVEWWDRKGPSDDLLSMTRSVVLHALRP
jgi:hypothetical protein